MAARAGYYTGDQPTKYNPITILVAGVKFIYQRLNKILNSR